jgi:uncharacterized protein YndB with AHSA1/START domain
MVDTYIGLYGYERMDPMSRLQVEAEATVRAEPAAVWALVSDATRYPQWGPWSAAGYRQPGDTSPRGPGAVYWLKSADRAYGRYVTTVEKVLEVEEARRLAYTVVTVRTPCQLGWRLL